MKQIAVIDDNVEFLELMEMMLTDEGYEPHTMAGTARALETLSTLNPAVVILDLRMETPLAGWDLLTRMKDHPALSHTPVIVCSADRQQLQKHTPALEEEGCVALPKPFDTQEFLMTLQRLAAASSI